MQAIPLRPVMDAEEYSRERDRLQSLYGNADGRQADVVAKRDQAFAELFYRSGWTQQQLADRENKSQMWVSYRLLFGKFVRYAFDKTMVLTDTEQLLTERKFRSLWAQTAQNNDVSEAARFDAVVRMLASSKQVSEVGLDEAPQKPPKEPKGRRGKIPAPKLDAARAIVRPLLEAGARISPQKLAEVHGVSHVTFDMAITAEVARREAIGETLSNAPIDISALGNTAKDRFAALESRLKAQLERGFLDRVQAEVNRHIEEYLMPVYGEKLEKAELLMKIGKPFTNAQFISLLRALHPDSSSAENRQSAFILLKEKEVLLRPEDKDRPLTSGLPTTVAELMKRKRSAPHRRAG